MMFFSICCADTDSNETIEKKNFRKFSKNCVIWEYIIIPLGTFKLVDGTVVDIIIKYKYRYLLFCAVVMLPAWKWEFSEEKRKSHYS